MQLINLALSFALYYPFFRMWDKQKLKEENELEAKASTDENVVSM